MSSSKRPYKFRWVQNRADKPRRPAELLDRLVGGVLGTAAGEAAQHLVRLGGAEP